MPDAGRMCFVMMPFVPELHYFYLYLKQYVEQYHGIRCERADDQVLTKLDNALRNALAEERYEDLYERAKLIFNEFKQTTGAQVDLAPKELFLSRVRDIERTERRERPPSMDDVSEVAKFVLPLIIADNNDAEIMRQIWTWLSEKRKTQ